MLKYRRLISSFLLAVFLLPLNACHFYKIGKVKEINSSYLSANTVEKGDIVIIHQGNNNWQLVNYRFENEILSGSLDKLTPLQEANYSTRLAKPNTQTLRYKRRKNKPLFPSQEVHLYVKGDISIDQNSIAIPVARIEKMEIYDEAIGATVASYVIPSAATAFAAMFIYLAIVCSCPYVYTYDGQEFNFEGGMFPGSIYPSLERSDFLPLGNLEPEDDNYRIVLQNEKMETEYINHVALEFIEHSPEVKVNRDKYGELITYSNAEPPINKIQELSERDESYFLFDEQVPSRSLIKADFTFNIPEEAETAKLIIRGKNTKWFDYVFTEFVELFGSYYDDFVDKQSIKPAEEHLSWMKEQGVVLNVYLNKNNKWEYYDYFHVLGSTVDKDKVMKIDLTGIDTDQLEVRLESGFQFWELDFLGMDFSKNESVIIHEAPLQSVTDSLGNDFKDELLSKDKEYISDFEIGDRVELKFKALSLEGKHVTPLFSASGYYRNNLSFEGKPNYGYLRSFRKPAALSEFSRLHYNALMVSISGDQ